MEKINIALVGCGRWGRNHLKSLNEINGFRVSYVCDFQGLPEGIDIREAQFTTEYKRILIKFKIN